MIHETKLEEGSRIYLVDKEQKNFAYNPYEEEIFTDKLGEYLELMTEEYQYIRTEGDYYIYSQIPGSSWMVLEKIPSFIWKTVTEAFGILHWLLSVLESSSLEFYITCILKK